MLELFPNPVIINFSHHALGGSKVPALLVLTAVLGGMAGLAFAAVNGHSLLQTLLSYQLGGLVAVLGVITYSFRPENASPGQISH